MLNQTQISEVKAYLALGHKHHDIAARYGVNGGRISEIASGKVGANIDPAPANKLQALKPVVRYFTPQQSIEEQIAILGDLTTNYSDTARQYLITPELAEYILAELNSGNRKVSSIKIAEYVDAMSSGEWPVTGASIVFGKSGRLLDGQHRLRACLRAKKPFRTFVVFGIDDGSFQFIDTGRKRTNPDVFKIKEIENPETTAKAVRWLYIFKSDPLNRAVVLTNYEALVWYEQHVADKALLSECVKRAQEIDKACRARRVQFPAGPTAALLYLFANKSKKDASAFIDMLMDAKGPARTLFSLLNEIAAQSGNRIHETFRNAATINAWNSFRLGKRASKDNLRYDAESRNFPQIH